ncbi:eIF-2-alpha kinase GCN2-like isoform X2 [Sesamum indicum]|uniref:EIF-2-alpha kinase GCN2-like isoform X2 n=1 Tax=Sesamum indicum TaxID=4182 RepID=A0A8M8V7N0_SESIN|nr:eIF-2-alpha kinase GCN2-like isoform X2 [Sesamum indicum]
MELVAEPWEENIKAEFVPLHDPSLTEQYECASEHDIKCLIVITDSGVSQKSSVKVVCHDTDKSNQLAQKDATTSSGKICFSGGHFVYGHLDLFSGSGELGQWILGMEENSKIVPSQIFDSLKTENVTLQYQMDKHMKPSVVESDKAGHAYGPSLRLGPLEEESEDETKSDSRNGESVGNGTVGYAKDIFVEGNLTETDFGDLDSDSESSSSDSATYDQPQTVKRDLLLINPHARHLMSWRSFST